MDTEQMRSPIQPWTNLAAPVLLWVLLWSELAPEWLLNDQYGYGLFVPILGAYLLMRRWADRPMPDPGTERSGLVWGLLVGLVILLFPFRIIYDANADWRMLTWIQALLTLGVTIGLLNYWGGRPWWRHFLPALIFWLFANPWVITIEKPVVNGLMTMVASWVVETANLLGVFAERNGNVIRLSNGFVSVEEACSGVRSLQSTLMASYFLGELLRFKWSVRAGLITAAAGLAVLFNFLRTLTLTVITARHGGDTMERWHDPAGYMVFLMSLTGLLLLTALAQKLRPDHRGAIDGTQLPDDYRPRLLSAGPLFAAMAVMLASVPTVWLWYSWREQSNQFSGWNLVWDKVAPDVQFDPINPRIEEVLHYSDGSLARWRGPGKLEWMAYFLRWDSARAAQLGGIHRPEACLPAGGWRLINQDEDFHWTSPEGLELVFNTYQFENNDSKIYVFYCQWDKTNYPYYSKSGRAQIDRLSDTWQGERKEGKIKLEIFVYKARTRDEALSELKEILKNSIQPEMN